MATIDSVSNAPRVGTFRISRRGTGYAVSFELPGGGHIVVAGEGEATVRVNKEAHNSIINMAVSEWSKP